MRLVTYTYGQRQRVGILEGETVYRIPFEVGMFDLIRRGVLPTKTSERYPLSEVTLHAPLAPRQIIAIGRNYADHAAELGNEVPSAPLLFAKLPSSVTGPHEPILWSESITKQVDWEAELAVIIGKRGKHISEADAMQYVFGYTIANDVSARDLQSSEDQWTRAKSIDTFCPMGPLIVTPDEIPDPHDLSIKTTVNGQTMQDGNTGQMMHKIPALIAYISRTFTLAAGDVILTGTPSGVGKGMNPPRFLTDGDSVTVSIAGIGELTNPCKVIA